MSSRVGLRRRGSSWARHTAALLSAVLLVGLVGCSSDSAGTTTPGSAGTSVGGGSSGAGGAAAGNSSMGGSSAGAVASGGVGGTGGANNGAGSGGTAAGGNAGNAGAGGASTAMWTTNGSKYSLTLGSTSFEVDAMLGGRITSFKVGGKEILADAATTGEPYYWGSTFWPSPQNWALPPTGTNTIATIDNQPYTAKLEGGVLTLTSALNTAPPAIVLVKKFSADVAKEAVIIEYTMTNGGTVPVTVAPWEVTRVAGGGLTFYPEASPPVLHDPKAVMPPTTNGAGARWFKHNVAVTAATKFFSDGSSGWVAHATGAATDLLLIKTFPDIQPADSPAGESEIEIYAVPKYVEVEQQGAKETLAVGASSKPWTVRWYARKLAAPAVPDSAELVTYVQNQIK